MVDHVPGEGASSGIDEHDISMINGGPRLLHGASQPSRLDEGHFMSSLRGNFRLYMQHDGHLVLYDQAGSPQWATGKMNPYTNWVVMQGDGNFVQYATDGWGVWPVCSTGTFNPAATSASYRFRLQDDGNMVLFDPYWTVLWSRYGGGKCT